MLVLPEDGTWGWWVVGAGERRRGIPGDRHHSGNRQRTGDPVARRQARLDQDYKMAPAASDGGSSPGPLVSM